MEESNYTIGKHGLQKLRNKNEPKVSPAARALGHAVSYLFHPLFIPTYVGFFLLFIHPLVFAGYSQEMKTFRLISIIFSTLFLPVLSVFLMWRLKLVITSFQLKTQQERIIPYAIAMVMYFWCWYVWKNKDSPPEMVLFLLGGFLSVCGAWMLNIPMRVSMHSTAVGALFCFFLILALKDPIFNGVYLSLVIFIAGLVCTARFIVSHHTAREIYFGFFAGVLCQLIALYFV